MSHRRNWTGRAVCLLILLLGVRELTYSEALNTSWRTTAVLNSARRLHTATLLPNGNVLVAGGFSGDTGPYNATNTAEIYDSATGSWRYVGNLHSARGGHTATLLPNGKVLVVGGVIHPDSPFAVTDTAELYDTATGTWSSTGKLNWARFWHTATLLPNGKVLVAGGLAEPFEVLQSAEVYDAATGTWTATAGLNTRRWLHTATLLPSGKVLVAGGSKGDHPALNTTELYDPATGIWSNTANLNSRYSSTAILLPTGKVLVAEGQNSESELYDSIAEIWNLTGQVQAFREQGYTTTLLPTGKVLLAGGYNYDSPVSTELYDPATGSWSSSGNLYTGRYGHTATLLPNGEVLVAGGAHESSNVYLNSAEVFNAGVSNLTGIRFDPIAVQVETSFFATFSGMNVTPETWFDIRFRSPGSTTDEVVLNWQRGSSAVHALGAGTAAGTYTVTGIRTHVDENDHTEDFNSAEATLNVMRQQ